MTDLRSKSELANQCRRKLSIEMKKQLCRSQNWLRLQNSHHCGHAPSGSGSPAALPHLPQDPSGFRPPHDPDNVCPPIASRAIARTGTVMTRMGRKMDTFGLGVWANKIATCPTDSSGCSGFSHHVLAERHPSDSQRASARAPRMPSNRISSGL
jgi:hypothetical protein